MKKTNFDLHLEQKLKHSAFAERFHQAGEAWDVAMQLANLRKRAGFSQKQLAHILKTSQQQISRLESTAYEGHSLSMLRRVAQAMHHNVHVSFVPAHKSHSVATKSKVRKNLAQRHLMAVG